MRVYSVHRVLGASLITSEKHARSHHYFRHITPNYIHIMAVRAVNRRNKWRTVLPAETTAQSPLFLRIRIVVFDRRKIGFTIERVCRGTVTQRLKEGNTNSMLRTGSHWSNAFVGDLFLNRIYNHPRNLPPIRTKQDFTITHEKLHTALGETCRHVRSDRFHVLYESRVTDHLVG